MTSTADKIDKLVPRAWHDRKSESSNVTLVDYKEKHLQGLSLCSFLEIIPIVNIFAAAFESIKLLELHDCQEHLSPNQMIIDLAKFYSAELPEPGPKRDFCIQVLTIMDNLELKGESFTKVAYNKEITTRDIYSNLYVNWAEGQDPKSCVLAELNKVSEYVNNPENENLPKAPKLKPGKVLGAKTQLRLYQHSTAKVRSARFKESLSETIKNLGRQI